MSVKQLLMRSRATVAATGVAVLVAAGLTVAAVPASAADSPYVSQVKADGATHYWRFGETEGNTGYDAIGGANLVQSGVSHVDDGAITSDPDHSGGFAGSGYFNGAYAYDPQYVYAPNTITLASWVKTTSTTGGRIIGFGDRRNNGTSNRYDRMVYLDNAGHVNFGVNAPIGARVIRSDNAINDGTWHQVVATLSAAGTVLYVDGAQVGADPSATRGETYGGYWRIGGDSVYGWANMPTDFFLTGSIDEVALYDRVLTPEQVKTQYDIAGGVVPNQAPTAVLGTSDCRYLACPFDGTDSTDADGTIAAYAWDFGDGTLSTDPTPKHEYTVAGTYTVSLTVTDDAGAESVTATTTVAPEANPAPTATIAAPTCTYLTCTFDGSGSSDDGAGLTYAWDFGDGDTSDEATPKHTFGADGSYDVTLTVTDDQGVESAPATVSLAVQDNRAPTAVIAAPTCTYLSCTFDATGSSDSDGTVTSYAWDFGDGETSTEAQPTHVYADGGDYDVTLVVTDADGLESAPATVQVPARANQAPTAVIGAPTCTYLQCAFDGTASSDPDTAGSVASYAWDFGDGTTGSGPAPSHEYAKGGSYTVSLVVTDDQGVDSAVREYEFTVRANTAPTAVIGTPSCTYLSCTFDGSGSTDDSAVATYAWNFGDGATATGPTPTHGYAKGGTYKVTLTVTDDFGLVSKPVTRSVSAKANVAPTAAFTSSCSQLGCDFDATGSKDSDGTVAFFAWNFGDGTTGAGPTPSHTYAKKGNFSVTLTVTDNAGAKGSKQNTITVTTVNNPPTAAFTAQGVGLTGNFDARASSDPDGRIVTYAWTFGDGTTGTGSTPKHAYAHSGVYPVSLTVTDNGGSSASAQKTLTVTSTAQSLLVSDIFNRTVSNGWGTSTSGTAWALGAASNTRFSVDGNVGRQVIGKSETIPAFPNANSLDSVQTVDVSVDGASLPASGVYAFLSARRTVGASYRLRVLVTGSGAVKVQLTRASPSREAILAEQTVPGLTVAAGTALRARFAVSGSGTTTLTGTVWKAGSAEPAAPQLTATDSTAGDLQRKGGFGITGTTYGLFPLGPVTLKYDNYSLVAPK